jgi:two-component system C4-dicarboxylate transport response regulator DctD
MTDDLRILIIEDDPDVALGCEQALQLEGFTAEAPAAPSRRGNAWAPTFPASWSATSACPAGTA